MRSFHWSTGASVFAGLLGAGVIDAALVLARTSGAPAFAVAALAADGPCVIEGAESASVSFPEFFGTLRQITRR